VDKGTISSLERGVLIQTLYLEGSGRKTRNSFSEILLGYQFQPATF